MTEVKNPTVVMRTEHCKEIVSLLSKEKVLAVDCQGVHLGANGTLTLLQISTSKEDVYLFDVHECSDLLSVAGLKTLLESERILKVMFNCSKDSGALRSQFNITLQNVFDIKVAHFIIEERKGRQLSPKICLDRVYKINIPDATVSEYKEEIMRKYAKENSGFWEKRPLEDDMKSYAAGNVRHLIKVYEKQKILIGESDRTFQDRMSESLNLQTDNARLRQRKHRIKEQVLKIIKSIDVEWNKNKSLTDFGKESDEWLALQRFALGEDQQHSELIKRLKKEMIKYELNEINEGTKEYGYGFIVGLKTFDLLSKAACHSDKSISREAKNIKKKVEGIILKDIENKYTEKTEFRYLNSNELTVLRNLPISADESLRYPHQINKLYLRLWEEDVDRESEVLMERGQDYNLKTWFYDKLKILVKNPSTPQPLRAKIKNFRENVNELSLV